MINRRDALLAAGKTFGLASAVVLTSAFREEALPKLYIQGHVESQDPTWDLLANLEALPNSANGADIVRFPDSVRRLAGQQFTVNGFMMQLDVAPYFNHFVLTRRNSSCPFCAPNGPGEAVEVFLPNKIGYSANEYAITGTLALFTSPSTGLYYRLNRATARRI